jgi:SWIM zinc finger
MSTSTMGTSDDLAVRPVAFEVQSASDPSRTHQVHLATCDCEDYRYRRGTRTSPFCRHIIAAYRLAGWQIPPWPAG